MTARDSTDPDFLRRCGRLAMLSRGTAIFLALLAVATALWPAITTADPDPRRWIPAMAFVVPALFYIAALWTFGRVFSGVAQGHSFGTSVTRGIRSVGLALLAGALASIVGVMLVSRALTGAGSYIRLDIPGITLACVGLGLVLFARLIDDARAMQAELDEMI